MMVVLVDVDRLTVESVDAFRYTLVHPRYKKIIDHSIRDPFVQMNLCEVTFNFTVKSQDLAGSQAPCGQRKSKRICKSATKSSSKIK